MSVGVGFPGAQGAGGGGGGGGGGATITDWASYSPTLAASMTNCTRTAVWRRVNDTAEIHVECLFTGAPSAGNFSIQLLTDSLAGLTVDQSKITGDFPPPSPVYTNDSGTALGVCYRSEAALWVDKIWATSNGTVTFFAQPGTQFSNVFPFSWTTNDLFSFSIVLPITEWAS